MDRKNTATWPALYCAMELSKNSWLFGIQFPDRQKASVYPIKGGDSEGLMAKLVAACDRWAKVSGKKPSIIFCYEAGYDAFWLARFPLPSPGTVTKAPKSDVPAPTSTTTRTRLLRLSGRIAAAATAVASGTNPRSMQSCTSFSSSIRCINSARIFASSMICAGGTEAAGAWGVLSRRGCS